MPWHRFQHALVGGMLTLVRLTWLLFFIALPGPMGLAAMGKILKFGGHLNTMWSVFEKSRNHRPNLQTLSIRQVNVNLEVRT